MKRKVLIAALLAGMSSIAAADRAQYLGPREATAQFARTRWQPLSPMLTADYWFGRSVVRIPEGRDELSALRLVNGSGATYVYSIGLRHGDGRVDEIPVNKWLYSGEQRMSFKLPAGCDVEQVTVTTFSWGYSTFQLLGERSRLARPPGGPGMEPPPPPPPAPAPGPVAITVARDVTFANTNGYLYLPIGAGKGLFSKIRIESIDSNMYIGSIHVSFDSGAHQTIEVNKALARGQVMDLDLTGTRSAITALELMDGTAHSTGRFSVALVR